MFVFVLLLFPVAVVGGGVAETTKEFEAEIDTGVELFRVEVPEN